MKKGLVVGVLCLISCFVFAQSGAGNSIGSIISTIVTLLIIGVYLGLCLIPAKIAKSKGRSFIGWYIFGILVFIVALVWSLCLKNKIDTGNTDLSKEKKQCP
jgi:hypothetical protein